MVQWRRRYRSLLLRIGRRGASLLFLALLDFAIAASLYPVPDGLIQTPLYMEISKIAPLPVWAVVWFIVGLACLFYAFKIQDRIAFSLAAAIKALWATIYVVAWIDVQPPRAWVGASVFFAFGAWVLIISTWPEVLPIHHIEPESHDAAVVADERGRIIAWSPLAEEMFGWTSEEMIGADVSRIMPDRFVQDHEAALNRLRETGVSELVGKAVQRTGLHKDGHEFPVEVVISILETHSGLTFTAIIRHGEAA